MYKLIDALLTFPGHMPTLVNMFFDSSLPLRMLMCSLLPIILLPYLAEVNSIFCIYKGILFIAMYVIEYSSDLPLRMGQSCPAEENGRMMSRE